MDTLPDNVVVAHREITSHSIIIFAGWFYEQDQGKIRTRTRHTNTENFHKFIQFNNQNAFKIDAS